MDPIALVLVRHFGVGVFSLGLACLNARDDVGSPAGLAASIGITSYNVLAGWFFSGLQQGRTSVACCCGDRPCRARRVVRIGPRGVETVREREGACLYRAADRLARRAPPARIATWARAPTPWSCRANRALFSS